ncbi:hypothetical protein C8R44DRAFT_992543 [Mycena epipterygia]|nr:hypothetical protein C8R44DRAFT_992543 [Mycena epipterygia]
MTARQATGVIRSLFVANDYTTSSTIYLSLQSTTNNQSNPCPWAFEILRNWIWPSSFFHSPASPLSVLPAIGYTHIANKWVSAFLDHHKVSNSLRTFRVVACNTEKMTNRNLTLSAVDGYPDAVYEPSKSEPELFHWQGNHWMPISKDKEGASLLRLQVWSCNHSVLDEFGQEPRTFYRKSPQPPPTRDYDYDWILLQSENEMTDVNEFTISTRQIDAGCNGEHATDVLRPFLQHKTAVRLLQPNGPNGNRIDDYTLGRLIYDTPSRCIILTEYAFRTSPSREEDDGETRLDAKGNRIPKEPIPPGSQVTLAGLLNILDSVASEEGRLSFATTNHIEKLDLALIRPGRMNLKIQYGLATSKELEQMSDRFYPYIGCFGNSVCRCHALDDILPALLEKCHQRLQTNWTVRKHAPRKTVDQTAHIVLDQ